MQGHRLVQQLAGCGLIGSGHGWAFQFAPPEYLPLSVSARPHARPSVSQPA
jgi:hypothetical protein